VSYGYRAAGSVGFVGPRGGFAVGWGRSSYFSATQVYGPAVVPAWGYVGPRPVYVVPAAALFPPEPRRPEPPPDLEVPDGRQNDAVNPGNFVVIRPMNRPPAIPPPPLPRDKQFEFVPKPGADGFPAADKPPADPKARAVFEVAAARAAFAAGEYGRAAERLTAAVRADPASPLPYFLLAQARTARGEYAEAVDALRDGLRLAPDWPASGFRPRELYGPAAARFDAHMADLRAALAAQPDDPTLQFLAGFHLWFLGERGEAAKLFRKAAGKVKDPGPADRFLTEFEGKKA
jgi:tetratricopeptide (TPR) repeat protein